MKRKNVNYRQTKSERSATRSNITFGHFQRMAGWVKTIVKSQKLKYKGQTFK